MSHQTNIVRIKSVNNLLSRLDVDFVFVGGAVVSLYVEREAEEARPTDDVDVLVEIYSRVDYDKMEARLRELGFQNDTTSKFVGRYTHSGLIVDFMPINEKVLGFSNRWYNEAFRHAVFEQLDEQTVVKIFSPPYFIATKLEAFKSRGKNSSGENDGRTSSDFEDIVFVLTHRESIWLEMAAAEPSLKQYLQDEFRVLMENPYFEEWIDTHTNYNSPAAQAIILPQVRTFIDSEQK